MRAGDHRSDFDHWSGGILSAPLAPPRQRRRRHGLAAEKGERSGVDRDRAARRVGEAAAKRHVAVDGQRLDHQIGVAVGEVRPADQPVVPPNTNRLQSRVAPNASNGGRPSRTLTSSAVVSSTTSIWPEVSRLASRQASGPRATRALLSGRLVPARRRSAGRSDSSADPPCWCRSSDGAGGRPATGRRACARRSRTTRSRAARSAGPAGAAASSDFVETD